MIKGKYIILLLGIGRLIDMSTGVNNYILNFSSHFRYSYLQIALPAILSIFLGFWLTPIYGMIGAAIASLCSIFCYNGISVFLNWHFFKMQPFSKKTVWAILIAFGSFCAALLVPVTLFHWLLAAIIRSIIFSSIFIFTIWKTKLSPDLNKLIINFLSIII